MGCLDCPRGMFAPTSDGCLRCPAGMYQDEQGRNGCKVCPSGTFSPVSGARSAASCLPTCGPGTYSPNGVVPCLSCPKDSYNNGSVLSGAVSCTACPVDSFTGRIYRNRYKMRASALSKSFHCSLLRRITKKTVTFFGFLDFLDIFFQIVKKLQS